MNLASSYTSSIMQDGGCFPFTQDFGSDVSMYKVSFSNLKSYIRRETIWSGEIYSNPSGTNNSGFPDYYSLTSYKDLVCKVSDNYETYIEIPLGVDTPSGSAGQYNSRAGVGISTSFYNLGYGRFANLYFGKVIVTTSNPKFTFVLFKITNFGDTWVEVKEVPLIELTGVRL